MKTNLLRRIFGLSSRKTGTFEAGRAAREFQEHVTRVKALAKKRLDLADATAVEIAENNSIHCDTAA